jgi:hypothetical protein
MPEFPEPSAVPEAAGPISTPNPHAPRTAEPSEVSEGTPGQQAADGRLRDPNREGDKNRVDATSPVTAPGGGRFNRRVSNNIYVGDDRDRPMAIKIQDAANEAVEEATEAALAKGWSKGNPHDGSALGVPPAFMARAAETDKQMMNFAEQSAMQFTKFAKGRVTPSDGDGKLLKAKLNAATRSKDEPGFLDGLNSFTGGHLYNNARKLRRKDRNITRSMDALYADGVASYKGNLPFFNGVLW